ncbi:protein FAR1-RELATED SEQUENCE 5-like [Phalaenopsis equestris]|uniref:protein FAR1-RELATED SEQUENCE 5-like n=1 Tax=Phalaenopsis equestris TaxID=78828 RepID=UPI0009E46FB5|nr:protein FAR1-RELATED SEQUENCE 5-like [Phalaenopsis equestris]
MESGSNLSASLGFHPSQEDEVEPVLQIQSQQPQIDEQSISILSLVPVPPLGRGSGGESSRAEHPGSESVDDFLPVSDQLEPKLGMEFDSSDDARVFYSAYAERVGFRVRNSKSFTSRVDDTVIMRRFVCSKQGRPSKKDPFDLTKKRRNRISSREGCKAMLQVNRRENGQWAVSRCVLEHCHSLGIVSKQFPSLQKKLAKKPWELIPSTVSEAQQNGLGVGGGVAQSLLEYFKRMQTDNPAFFYAIQVDQNNCLANVFWADARARMAYGYFGDAIVFDMTCKKNKRMVPFAAFSGINHHRQLIVFGCAFMTDENEASFIWLFETWLCLMSGRCPVSFVTPFNDVIGSAAAKVFPNVQHRFCQRDVFRKCKENLSDVYSQYASFKSEFKKCVNEPESSREFELAWRLLLDRYGLEGNMWLKSLYNVRQKWVPAYLRGTFYAEIPGGLLKSETMHNFFQRNSITTTTLRDLVSQFDKAMAGQSEKEIHADFAMIHSKPVMKTPSPIEKQASEIYTRVIFDLVQEELVEASSFLMDKVEDGMICKFRVTKVDADRAYFIVYNASENTINCSCSMYETCGILCRHVFKVLMVLCALALPSEYILRRWTRNAKSAVLSYENCAQIPSNSYRAFSLRCNDLFHDAIRYAEEGATSVVIYKVAKEALQNAFNEVFSAKRGSFFNITK